MTFPQHLVRATSRVVLGASLALTALCIADANPAGASRGGDDQEIEDAGATTTTTMAPTTTTTVTTVAPQTVDNTDPGADNAGDGQQVDTPVQSAGDPAPAEEPMAAVVEAPAPEARPTLPRTGAGSVAQEAVLGLGLVGAGLAATAAGRRRRSTTA